MLKSFLVLFSCLILAKGHVLSRCELNEESRCVTSCPPEKTCKNRHIQFSCLAVFEPCEHRCVCKEGYFRNPLGTCITEAQCNQCSGKNEFFACDSACDNECSTLHKQNRTNCPIINITCNKLCYCENDFARDHKGHCIPVEKCLPLCPNPNEEYKKSQVANCPVLDTCTSIVASIRCDKPEAASCVCKSGYLRLNETSACIPICECPQLNTAPECQTNFPLCPNPNEEYKKSLVANCPLLGTCTSIVARIKCDKPEAAACVCKSGYLRLNETSACIPTCECPQMKTAPECQTDCS